MTQFLKKIFGAKKKKNSEITSNKSSDVVLVTPEKREYISLSAFCSTYKQNPMADFSRVRVWLINQKILEQVEFSGDHKLIQVRVTALGENHGFSAVQFGQEGSKRTSIYLDAKAQNYILKSYLAKEVENIKSRPEKSSDVVSVQPSTPKGLYFTEFCSRNATQIGMSRNQFKGWLVNQGYLETYVDNRSPDKTQYRATSKAKDYGITTKLYQTKDVFNTAIYFSPVAQEVILNSLRRQEKIEVKHIKNQQSLKVAVPSDYTLSIDDPYFDSILHDIDRNIKLDREQRTAVISNKDNVLIVAGAGAGKTTTMAAKVKYLVEKQGVKPDEIIMISYTNKAINELKERIQKKLRIPVEIATFHKFAFDVVKLTRPVVPKINYSAWNYISEYTEHVILNDPNLLRKLVLFLGYYFDIPVEAYNFRTLNEFITAKANRDYETLKSNLGEYVKAVSNQRLRYQKTIQGEYLRSAQEVQLANFFYLHSIDYEYEKVYPITIPRTNKPYTPDFFIKQGELEAYIEHFGITESHQHSLYSEEQLKKYIQSISFKRNVHASNGTVLLETYSQYDDGRSLMEHLSEILVSHGFTLTPRDSRTVYDKITETSKDRYIFKFNHFVKEFIELFKTNGYTLKDFEVLRNNSSNVRTKMFLEIAEGVYTHYQYRLHQQNEIDFADMINEAAEFLSSSNADSINLKYKYIIIDEFQDIARQRFDFAKVLASRTDAKITAVGDDWQSIFAFAGSDISLFTRFIELMGSGEEMKITHTYRNSQQLIDIAGHFVQKNSNQIRKSLISPKQLNDPVRIVEYDDSTRVLRELASKTTEVIGEILERNPRSDILLLGRYNFDLYRLCMSGEFVDLQTGKVRSQKYPSAKLTFLTCHSSKGLGFDEVIVLNMSEGTFGFPSQIENDPIMKLVVKEDHGIRYSEERRLFYVSLTRTKNHVYLMTPQSKPSRFVIELVKDHQLPHSDKLSLEINDKFKHRCPKCGYPLKFVANHAYGLSLYICTNEPELCQFMTNQPKVMQDIFKCPSCHDGYMITKPGKEEGKYFLGCTNFRKEGVKCTNSMQIGQKESEQ